MNVTKEFMAKKDKGLKISFLVTKGFFSKETKSEYVQGMKYAMYRDCPFDYNGTTYTGHELMHRWERGGLVIIGGI